MSEMYNDDLDLDDEQDGGDSPKGDNNPVRDLRAKLRRLEKERKAEAEELAQLRAYRAEAETQTRRASIAQAFSSLGLPEAYAELYPGEAEPTVEAIQGFALKYGWVQPQAKDEEEVAAPTFPTFSPTHVQGVSPAQSMIDQATFQRLVTENPAAAAKALKEGRVKDEAAVPDTEAYDW